METIDEAQLWILSEVFDSVMLDRTVSTAEHPADVGPKSIVGHWRVDVFFLVGMLMMVPVIGCPPHRTKLCGRSAYPGHDELEGAACFEGTVRKITVKACSQREDPDYVSNRERQNCNPAETSEKDSNSRNVHEEDGGRCHQ